MNKHEFRLRFGNDIRVNVNWKRFAEGDVELRERVLALPEQLNILLTPWYPGGASHALAPGAEPLSVIGAASDLSLIGTHADGIETCLNKMRATDFEAPAIRVSRGRYLLLDQNHHVTALAINKLPVTLKLFVIEAPHDVNLLTDIRAFDSDVPRRKV